MSRRVQQLMRAAIEHPTRTLLLWLALAGVASVGVASIQIDTTTDSVLDREAEAWDYYQYSQELFGGDEIVVVTLDGDRPFDRERLDQLVHLSGIFEQIPGVRRVDSLASVPLIRSTPDGRLDLTAALESGVPGSASALERLADLVLADRLAPRNLVSEDGRVFALNVILEQGFEGYAEVVDAIRASLPPTGSRISGVPVFRSEANARTRAEILFFIPITGLAMGCLIFFVYRSLYAVALALGIGMLGTWTMVGAMSLFGAPISLITMILPTVILALGCAYVMHVLSAGSGAQGREELTRRLLPVAEPIALSGITTAIGFAVIGIVRIEEVRHVGVFGSVGVVALTLATLTLAPAVLSVATLSARPPRLAAWAEGPLRATLMRVALGRRQLVIGIWTILLVVFSLGALRLDVETDATRWFPHGSEVRDSYESIRSDLSGISPVNIIVESRGDESLATPAAVRAIDGLARHLETMPDVGKAVSIGDPLRQMHGGFAGDPDLPLPDQSDLIQQYLLLLEGEEEIEDLITRSHDAANVVLRMDNNGSAPILDAGVEAERWWRENGIAELEVRTTGIMYEFARAEDEISLGQLRGLIFALAAIALVLYAALRRLDLASIALVPNALPIIMVFGFMGLIGVPLDAGTVIVGSLALGIAVDDTMHLVTAFAGGLRAGVDVPTSLDRAIRRVAHPMTLTTIAVGLGFGLLGFSQFTITRNLGLLVAGTMGVCLMADLVLLPALLGGIRAENPKKSSDADI